MSASRAEGALVLGTGVSGLSCALTLARAGFAVEAWERGDVAREVSSVAAAIWYPYLAGPAGLVERWALETLAGLERIAADRSSGVTLCDGIEVFPAGVEPPAFLRDLPAFREIDPREVPAGRARGFAFRLPVVEMEIYLPWLRARCAAAGVRFFQREVRALDEAIEHSALVVNCTGLASRELAHDRALVPIRGQVVRIAARFTRTFVLDERGPEGLCYIVPRSRDVILGSSIAEGRTDLDPDPLETAQILARAARHLPGLTAADVLGVKVGLRPGRPAVRLEAERPRPGRLLVHDYGHGGAGVTLSLGCAEAVLALVQAARAGAVPR